MHFRLHRLKARRPPSCDDSRAELVAPSARRQLLQSAQLQLMHNSSIAPTTSTFAEVFLLDESARFQKNFRLSPVRSSQANRSAPSCRQKTGIPYRLVFDQPKYADASNSLRALKPPCHCAPSPTRPPNHDYWQCAQNPPVARWRCTPLRQP